nr:MotA/TolQ/ExbB proton channel family protein [uncultured Draconibacterium sp.]
MNFMQFHKEGGPFMGVITVMGVLMLIVAGIKIYQITVQKHYDLKLVSLIRMAGLFAAALGVLSQITGIVQALEAIRAAEDISPQLVMGGAIVSFYTTIWGLIVLLVSLPIYFVLKEFIKQKMKRNN